MDAIAASAANESHSLALVDGEVWAWGRGNYGQLGNGSTTTRQTTPVKVSSLTGVSAIAAGWSYSLALIGGEVWAWGYGFDGQLGNGTTTSRQTTPVKVSALTGAGAIAAGSHHSLAPGVASPTNGVTSGSAYAGAGESVTTDIGGAGATPESPVQVAVSTPNGGTVSIVLSTSLNYTFGNAIVIGGRRIEITAPDADHVNPIVLAFTLDASIFPAYLDVSFAYVYRDGRYVTESCNAPTVAAPDPCIAGRTRLANGDVEIVVRTSRASDWGVLMPGLPVTAGGPYSVSEGSSVALNGSASGGTSPYSFLWDFVPGLDDPFAASPTFAGLDDGVFPLRLTALDSLGIPGEDETQVTVTNVAPVVAPIQVTLKKEKANTLVKVSATFTDAGVLDTHTAWWTWGNGKANAGELTGANGSGTATGSHTFNKAGTYTITLRVTDDDGGAHQRAVTINVTK